jgi:hypothetical protein
MSNSETKLLLLMSDVLIRHVEEALNDAPDDDEIETELQELITTREAVLSIYNESMKEQNIIDFVPKNVSDFLTEHQPDVFPISVELFSEKPVQYLLKTAMPISQKTADLLDQEFEDMIVLEYLPIR